MTLSLGQRGCLSSTDILPQGGPISKGFGTSKDVNSLTYIVLVDRHRRHGDGIGRQVTAIARGADDLVDDVHALGDLPEQRVVLGQLAGQILVADEELAA